jgi:hypothetical protein
LRPRTRHSPLASGAELGRRSNGVPARPRRYAIGSLRD